MTACGASAIQLDGLAKWETKRLGTKSILSQSRVLYKFRNSTLLTLSVPRFFIYDMKLIEPNVELWSEEGVTPEQHIARCARTCYGHEDKASNQEADKKMVDGLIKRGHLSMLRHASVYININGLSNHLVDHIENSDYWVKDFIAGYASTNLQEFEYFETLVRNKKDSDNILPYDNNIFLEECAKDVELFKLYRLTFCITTQISTSRELNRVSPNNIAERSTRYCSSKNGLEICKPWWWTANIGRFPLPALEQLPIKEKLFAETWQDDEWAYIQALQEGMNPEDARGVLPLDTATKVVMTYSVREWKHIIDLRYYGTTGTPHPNTKLVIGMVRDKLNEFAKAHNIDYQV